VLVLESANIVYDCARLQANANRVVLRRDELVSCERLQPQIDSDGVVVASTYISFSTCCTATYST
jgi:hypothetical protein